MPQPPEVSALLDVYRTEMHKRVVGQREMIDGLLMALIAGGHVLLEGVPGLAKTLAVKCLAEITALDFKRIQFTPDLLPADLTGTLIWEQASGSFSVRRGPVFANLILADEINRAPAKVQSALLEAMEEYQVTIGETTYPLPSPFFVLATQNPIEHEGTYPLPEAELDRFLLKLKIKYPQSEEELRILESRGPAAGRNRPEGGGPALNPALKPENLVQLRDAAEAVRVDEQIARYLIAVVAATRPPAEERPGGALEQGAGRAGREGIYRFISFGASPRASIALYRCARVAALFAGRDYVVPEDVKRSALPVLRHRVVLSYEALADGLDADAVISRILAFVPAP